MPGVCTSPFQGALVEALTCNFGHSFNERLESFTEAKEELNQELGQINSKQTNTLRHDLVDLGQPKYWKDPFTKYKCEPGKCTLESFSLSCNSLSL